MRAVDQNFERGLFLWTLSSAVGALLISGIIILAPLAGFAIVLVALFFWTFTWELRKFFAAQFSLAVVAIVSVPFLRLTESQDMLKLAVPALIIATSLAVLIRIKGSVPVGMGRLVLLYFLLELLATGARSDPNEWQILAVSASVALAGLAFAGAAVRLDAWSMVSRILIVVVVLEAALSLYEVVILTQPIWRGGKVLPDGNSVWLRNELVSGWPRAQGTFAHPLPLSLMLVLGAILLIRTPIRRAWLKPILFAIMGAGVLASGSRNSIVLFIALTALAYALPSLAPRLHLMATVTMVAFVFAFPFVLEKYDELVQSGSVTHRLGALDAVSNLMGRPLLQTLLGDGAASTPRLYSSGMLQTDGLAAVDNQYVLTLAQNGFVGLTIFVAILIVAMRRGSATLRMMILGVIISGMIFDLLAWPAIGFFVWFLTAVSFARMPGTAPLAIGVKNTSTISSRRASEPVSKQPRVIQSRARRRRHETSSPIILPLKG